MPTIIDLECGPIDGQASMKIASSALIAALSAALLVTISVFPDDFAVSASPVSPNVGAVMLHAAYVERAGCLQRKLLVFSLPSYKSQIASLFGRKTDMILYEMSLPRLHRKESPHGRRLPGLRPWS
jgi:hypothetical protein